MATVLSDNSIYTRVTSARLDALLWPSVPYPDTDAHFAALAEAATLLREGKRSANNHGHPLYTNCNATTCNGDPVAYIESAPGPLRECVFTATPIMTEEYVSIWCYLECTLDDVQHFYRVLAECPTPLPGQPAWRDGHKTTPPVSAVTPGRPAWIIVLLHGGANMLVAAFAAGLGIGSNSACTNAPNDAGRPQLDLVSATVDMTQFFQSAFGNGSANHIVIEFFDAVMAILDKGELSAVNYTGYPGDEYRYYWGPIRSLRQCDWVAPLARDEWHRVFYALARINGISYGMIRTFCTIAYANGYKVDIANGALSPAMTLLMDMQSPLCPPGNIAAFADAVFCETLCVTTPAIALGENGDGFVDPARGATGEAAYIAWKEAAEAYAALLDGLVNPRLQANGAFHRGIAAPVFSRALRRICAALNNVRDKLQTRGKAEVIAKYAYHAQDIARGARLPVPQTKAKNTTMCEIM